MQGRVWFEGNPWPQGHTLAEFTFAACMHEGGVGLILHARTQSYYDEFPEAFDEDEDSDEESIEPPSEDWSLDEWQAKGAWGNFQVATISNLYWGVDYETLPRFRVEADGSGGALAAKRQYEIDPLLPEPVDGFDSELNSFQAYILGHDTTRAHRILMERVDGVWAIEWSGRIARCYVGETDYRFSFRLGVRNVPFDGFMIENPRPPPPLLPNIGRRLSEHSWKPAPPDPAVREARALALAKRHLGGIGRLRFDCGRGFDPDWLRPVPLMTD